jgi:hypothetical protein
MIREWPDWGQPKDADGVSGYRAHPSGRILVLPDRLALAQGPDGQPAFRLSGVRPEHLSPTQRGHGRLEMTLVLRADAASPDGRVQAVPALRGWLWLVSRALDLPEELRAPAELRCSGIGAADVSLPLRPEGFIFIERTLAEGAVPVLALARLEVAGIARAVAGKARVDHGALRAALASGLRADALSSELLRDAAALGVRIESADPFAAEAAADRIRAVLCDGPLRPTDDGLELVWSAAVPGAGETVLDLASTILATRVVTVQLDPFAEARQLANQEGLIRRVVTPTLRAGQHRLTFSANLPRPLVGPLAVGARLVVPPRPPQRNHELREDVEFADVAPVERIIRLAPNEPLNWRAEATCWVSEPDGRSAVLLSGPSVEGTGTEIDLGPQHYPLVFVRVAAGSALLDVAAAELTLGGGGRTAEARLTAKSPQVALALPDADTLAVRVVAPDGQAVNLERHPAEDCRIELTDLPGYGSRQTEISVSFPPNIPLRALELRSGDGSVQTLAFTPARPTRNFEWFCGNPFEPGLLWRWQGSGAFVPIEGDQLRLDAGHGEGA